MVEGADWGWTGVTLDGVEISDNVVAAAWLEGQGEGLNLINLLASQWGRLFTNVADISGAASGCKRSPSTWPSRLMAGP